MIHVKNKALIKAIGEKIQLLRKKRGLSQEQLAYEADIMLSQIGRIERGETNPTISTLAVLAEALQVPLTELVDVKLKNK